MKNAATQLFLWQQINQYTANDDEGNDDDDDDDDKLEGQC